MASALVMEQPMALARMLLVEWGKMAEKLRALLAAARLESRSLA
jgi:hypothetical protein